MTMFKRARPLSEKSALEQYVDRVNALNKLFDREEITFPLSEECVRGLMYRIEGELSPENLNCDGEISAAEANRKWEFLQEVYEELEMCDDWGITYKGE
jgi:hypothetical protein